MLFVVATALGFHGANVPARGGTAERTTGGAADGSVEEPAARTVERTAGAATAPSENGVWRGAGERHVVTARSSSVPLPMGRLHDWVLEIRTPEGVVARPRRIQVGGGMRIHGHGLPSRPVVERYLGEGRWLLSGLSFNMAGPWQLAFRLTDEAGDDDVVLSVQVGTTAAFGSTADADGARGAPDWSADRRAVLGGLVRSTLGEPRADTGNRVADDPAAAAFGEALFHDPGLSGDGRHSCASCHRADLSFTDGRRTGVAAGELVRNTPTVLDAGFQRWLTWDGRRDSLWAQALGPIESPDELASDRVRALRHVARTPTLREAYRGVFGELPLFEGLPERAGPMGDDVARAAWKTLSPFRRIEIDTAFANVGKAIAAYERTLESGAARFDRFVEALLAGDRAEADRWMSPLEQRGLARFVDPANLCLNCHNGPLFSNRGFHNIGTGEGGPGEVPDFGRLIGVQAALMDPFNCRGAYADGESGSCESLEAARRTEIESLMRGAFKVPSLREVARTAPLHARRTLRHARGRRAALPRAPRGVPRASPAVDAVGRGGPGDRPRSCARWTPCPTGRVRRPPYRTRPSRWTCVSPAAPARPVPPRPDTWPPRSPGARR